MDKMISNELISVIIPVYNVDVFLEQCLESVIKQSYQELEIILVDDGSTDQSGTICDHFATIDKRIKVIHKPNGGLSDARNVGLDIAKGAYITFIDSDDYVSIDFVKSLYEAIKSNGAEISICDYMRTKIDNDQPLKEEQNVVVYNNIDAIKNTYLLKFHGLEFVAWAKLYKRTLFVDNGLIFPVGKLYEDTYTTYKAMFYSNKIVYITSKLYFYRMRDNSITNMPYNKQRITVLDATREACDFYKANKAEDLYKFALNDHYKKSVLIYKEFIDKYHEQDKQNLKRRLIRQFKIDTQKYGIKQLGTMKILYYFGFKYLPSVLCKFIK